MKSSFAVVAAAALSLASWSASASPLVRGARESENGMAPLYTPPNPWASSPAEGLGTQSVEGNIIADSYIVVLKEEHGHRLPLHLEHLERHIANRFSSAYRNDRKRGVFDILDKVVHHFDLGTFKGYAGKFSQDTLEFIRRHPAVEFVERDSVVMAMDLEKNAPWGLARLSHRKALTLGTLGKYEYEHEGGEGVDVYVIDTGVNIKHVEFEGRAIWGRTMPQDDVDEDGNGHGSHVAGTIASRKYGVAKLANLIAVKVLGSGGSGSMSDVVGGVAWAANAAIAKMQTEAAKNGTHKGSVANMSLGGGKSPALDLAVNNAVKKGLHFAVAAGNDNRDACAYSPAAAENAITVGASTLSDSRAYFSNFGECVDIFAPGLNILSTWNGGNNTINTISGTSMAAPHIAGLTAYFLSLYGEEFQPSKADYIAAGVPVPGSAEERRLAEKKLSWWSKGHQLVFGSHGKPDDDAPAITPLDPKVLKKAMIRLSTKDILTEIPDDGTPNYLAFNNYTVHRLTNDEDLDEKIVSIQPVFEKGEAMLMEALENLEEAIEEIIAEDSALLAGH